MIIVLAGSTEGRQMVSLLNEEGWANIACVVSAYGAELLQQYDSTDIYRGCLDKTGLIGLINNRGASLLLDATHPFASQISILAMEVADLCKIPYIRLERERAIIPDNPLVKRVESLEEIQDFIIAGQTVFSTLGSNHLPLVVAMVKRAEARLVARVLPVSRVVKECEALGLNPDSIIAVKGPFSKKLNQQLFKHYGAELILSKESGPEGGFNTKLEAAEDLGIPIVVWTRPSMNYPVVFHKPYEVMQYIREIGRNFR